MAHFPTTFAEQAQLLEPGIGERGDAALAKLHEKGYSVVVGLAEYHAGAIGVMGYQSSIREYCPKDSTDKRFGSLESTEKWLNKGGGRGALILQRGKGKNAQPVGYGWAGVEPCDELPDHPITTAYRIGEQAQGQGLGRAFIQVVVSATNTLYAPGEGIGLETWQSNHAAGMYQDVGFELIDKAPNYELRPSLNMDPFGGVVFDRRLYMGYPSKLLEA